MPPIRIAALLAVLSAVAPAPLLAQSSAPADTTAARAALTDAYQAYCLDRFMNRALLLSTIADRNLPTASQADTDHVLKGRPGQAWVIAGPAGPIILALWDTPARGCAVTAAAPEDATTRATFDVTVTMYAGAHELGALTRPAVRSGTVGGAPAAMQLIGADPGGQPREAFVNLATTRNGAPEARFAREWAPTPAAQQSPASPQSKP